MRGPLSITAVASFAALVAGGCATLPAIEAGTCGNGIVEASEGEDCESLLEGRIASRDKAMSLDSNLHHCGRSSGEGASRAPESCRFTCDRAAPATKACPESRVCGADGICREPSGGFGRVESVPAEGVALSAADFDGDGRAELVATGRRNIEVVTWDKATRLLERMTRIGSRTVRPTAGSFGAKEQAPDALADLAVIREGGLVSLFRGTKGRDLEPQFFAAFKSNGTNFQLIPVDVLPGRIAGTTPLEYGLEVLVYVTRTKSDGTVVNELNFLDATLNQFTLATTPKSAAELAGPLRVGRFHDYVGVPVAQFDQVLPCESLVLPFRGDDAVTLIEPCRRKGATVEANTLGPDYVPTPALKLDDGFRSDRKAFTSSTSTTTATSTSSSTARRRRRQGEAARPWWRSDSATDASTASAGPKERRNRRRPTARLAPATSPTARRSSAFRSPTVSSRAIGRSTASSPRAFATARRWSDGWPLEKTRARRSRRPSSRTSTATGAPTS
ncbi:MAG: hypothetical protein IPG50_02325 [Myxococcales bacterium]|nr:hypothetical protein [Myxococcales bacterium]